MLILAGAGKTICAGHDIKEMRSNPTKEFQRDLFRQCSKLVLTLVRMPQPVIARVHGIATAAGCQLDSMCDLAVAADNARVAVSGVNMGLFCSTPSVGLARNVGRKQALEMLLTGDFIDAQTALARQRAVVAGDVVLAQTLRELMRYAFGQTPRVDEDQGRFVGAYEPGEAVVDVAPLLTGSDGLEVRRRHFYLQVEVALVA